jgi:flagellar basal-body rod modification protein FlgD
MEINPTSNLAPATAGLQLEDLLRVLLTELTHQNPLKPVDNKDFMGQIAQFAALDSSQRLNGNIEQLLLVQAINQSVGLIGRTVTANLGGSDVTGKVTAMSLADGVPRMTITDSSGNPFVNVSIGQLKLIL